MKELLYAKNVITYQEKLCVDKKTGTDQMASLLHILITSLNLGQTGKFQGFLEAMKESGDLDLIETAKRLTESGRQSV